MKKKLFYLVPLLSILFSCNNKKPNKLILSKRDDYVLADSIHFEHSIIDELRKETSSKLERLITEIDEVDLDHNEKITRLTPDALKFKYEGKDAMALVLKLKDDFKRKGYFIFRSSQNFGHELDEIGVLKSNDQFDILKYKATNGINYGIETDSVISKLREWHRQFKFDITGADFDWVEATFIDKPSSYKTFAEEVYKFSPDVVEQGTSSIDALAKEMEKTNTLYLWWD
jgi:hypothetical protein